MGTKRGGAASRLLPVVVSPAAISFICRWRGRALYAQHLVSYFMNRMPVISRLRRLSPFGGCATTSPPNGGTMDSLHYMIPRKE